MMNKKSVLRRSNRKFLRTTPQARPPHLASALLLSTALSGFVLAAPQQAHAYSIYSGYYGGQQLEINLNTTLEYSPTFRIHNPSKVLTNDINANDGDLNFQHGLVDNTFSVVPVFDLKYGNYGIHLSGQAYLDTVYLQKNQNNSPTTYNPISTSSNRDFTSATRNVNGQNAMLLDAFVYGSQYFGKNDAQELTVKVGRQTLIWGQSLFFASNGIAAGQAPLDIITAESLPNAQAQQIFMPVGQVVVTYQPNQIFTLQAYYQFEWEHDLFQGSGAYFSSSDVLDKGGQRLLFAPGIGTSAFAFYRVKDNSPPIQNGQFGASIQATLGNYDVGLYGLRFDAKAPELYLGPAQKNQPRNSLGSYYLVYPRDIQVYGASVSTTVGAVNVAGEISGRRNMPLVSGAGFATTYPGSANAGALYAVGSTMAAQASFIYVSPAIPLDPGGVTLDGEVAMNHVISVDSGKAELTPGRQATAGAFEVVATPTYFFNFLPNWEVEFPVGITYNFLGRSEIDATMNHGVGAFTAGLTAVYAQTWTAGVSYKDYLGKVDPSLNPLADRGYVSFNIEHTF